MSPGDNSIYETLASSRDLLIGVTLGMLCANIWMRADYGAGSHRFGANEMSVFGHLLGEVRNEYTE